MKFCPECGKLLTPLKKKGQIVYMCSNCKKTFEERAEVPVRVGRKTQDDPLIIDHSHTSEGEGMPKTKVVCPKCGNLEAFWWMQQTRSADEATTRFFRCTRCGNVWREYD
jgi:DNA-directed RNA polymerase subunit M